MIQCTAVTTQLTTSQEAVVNVLANTKWPKYLFHGEMVIQSKPSNATGSLYNRQRTQHTTEICTYDSYKEHRHKIVHVFDKSSEHFNVLLPGGSGLVFVLYLLWKKTFAGLPVTSPNHDKGNAQHWPQPGLVFSSPSTTVPREARLVDLPVRAWPISWPARGMAEVARSNILLALLHGLLLRQSPLSCKPIVCR